MLHPIDKSTKNLFIISILVGVLTTAISFLLPIKYKTFNTLYIDRLSEKSNDQYFTYEGMYSQQTAEKFTDTVKGLLTSSNLIGTVLEKNGIENNTQNRKFFQKSLVIKKTGPQVLYIEIKGKYNELLNPLISELSQYIGTINGETDKKIIIKTVTQTGIQEEIANYPTLNGLITFSAVFFFGFIYLKRKVIFDFKI